MTTTLTIVGQGHLANLEAGNALSYDFHELKLGRGNDPVSQADVAGSISDVAVAARIADGYPKRNDDDVRNEGRSALRWTWKFVVEGGPAFVASNVLMSEVGAGGTAAAMMSGAPRNGEDQALIEKRGDQRLFVYVNARTGEAPVVSVAHEEVDISARRGIYVPRARVLAAAVEGIPTTAERALARRGERVFLMALIPNDKGEVMRPDDVVSGTLRYYRRTRIGTWELAGQDPISAPIEANLVTDDARWPHAEEGYNFGQQWRVPTQRLGLRYALEVEIQTTEGPQYESWEVDVEGAPGAFLR